MGCSLCCVCVRKQFVTCKECSMLPWGMVKGVFENVGCLLWELYGTYKYTMWTNSEFLVLNLAACIVATGLSKGLRIM